MTSCLSLKLGDCGGWLLFFRISLSCNHSKEVGNRKFGFVKTNLKISFLFLSFLELSSYFTRLKIFSENYNFSFHLSSKKKTLRVLQCQNSKTVSSTCLVWAKGIYYLVKSERIFFCLFVLFPSFLRQFFVPKISSVCENK